MLKAPIHLAYWPRATSTSYVLYSQQHSGGQSGEEGKGNTVPCLGRKGWSKKGSRHRPPLQHHFLLKAHFYSKRHSTLLIPTPQHRVMPATEQQGTGTGNAADPPGGVTEGPSWRCCSCVGLLGTFEENFQQRVRKHLYLRLALTGLFASVVVCLTNLPQVVLHFVLKGCALLHLCICVFVREHGLSTRVSAAASISLWPTPTARKSSVARKLWLLTVISFL
jgi:hypothetical protein